MFHVYLWANPVEWQPNLLKMHKPNKASSYGPSIIKWALGLSVGLDLDAQLKIVSNLRAEFDIHPIALLYSFSQHLTKNKKIILATQKVLSASTVQQRESATGDQVSMAPTQFLFTFR